MILRKGRFGSEMDDKIREFSSSLEKDRFLAPYDISQSIAHSHALEKAGLISSSESKKLCSRLKKIGRKIKEDPGYLSSGADDIHMAIEEELGDIGKKLHAGRSRNDQVACDMRMYVRDSARELAGEIEKLSRAVQVADISAGGSNLLMPVYTHLQRAQAVRLSTYLGAYRAWLDRDSQRLRQFIGRINLLPLGAAASAGSNIKLDLDMIAGELGFEGVIENPVDAVSSRDYLIEYSCIISIFGSHLSRMAEDFIIFSTREFDFISLSDRISDTSSIMPQKKNPDCLELVRSASGRLTGAAMNLFTVVKSLPLSYNRDMQDDKEIYRASQTALNLAAVMRKVMENIEFNTSKMDEAAKKGFTDAADFAEYLSLRKNFDFRKAHSLTGALVREGIKKGYESLSEFKIDELKEFLPEITEDVFEFIDHIKASGRRLGEIGGDKIDES